MINAQCPMFNLPQAARGGPLEISDCRMQNSGAKQAAMTKGLADPPRRVKFRIADWNNKNGYGGNLTGHEKGHCGAGIRLGEASLVFRKKGLAGLA